MDYGYQQMMFVTGLNLSTVLNVTFVPYLSASLGYLPTASPAHVWDVVAPRFISQHK